jgi:hypothetical protein
MVPVAGSTQGWCDVTLRIELSLRVRVTVDGCGDVLGEGRLNRFAICWGKGSMLTQQASDMLGSYADGVAALFRSEAIKLADWTADDAALKAFAPVHVERLDDETEEGWVSGDCW